MLAAAWWSGHANVVVPVVGAIIVALIAAVTAQHRLTQQLAHDRSLRDLDELRSLLDECAQVAGRATHAHGSWGWFLIERDGSVVDPTVASLPANAADAVSAFFAELEPLGGLYQRVVLRVGEGHEVAANLLALQGALTVAGMTMGPDPSPGDELFESWLGEQNKLRKAHFSFLSAAQDLVGSRLA